MGVDISNVYALFEADGAITSGKYPTGIRLWNNRSGARDSIRNVRIDVSGTMAGAFTYSFRGIDCAGTDCCPTIENYTFNYALTTTNVNVPRAINLGESSGSFVGSRVRQVAVSNSTNATIAGVTVHSLNTLDAGHIVSVADCEFSECSPAISSQTGHALYVRQSVTQLNTTAAPTEGTWVRGNVVWNSAPAAGGYVGWVCVASGTPGTWKGFGAIES
jgi:hypothetical protein